jgi:hypothetical protein
MKNYKIYILSIAVLFTVILPFVSLAQGSGANYNFPVSPSVPATGVTIPISNPVNSSTSSSVGTSATLNTGTCSATTLPANPKLGDLFDYITCMISNSVVPLIFALAVVIFIWGVVQYVINTDDEAKRAKGKQFMLWGIIALAVMVSVWGLVDVLGNTFGVTGGVIPKVVQ